MTVHELRPQPTHVSGSPTARAMRIALALTDLVGVPEPSHLHVHTSGRCITFDYTNGFHPAGDVRTAAALAGIDVVDELAVELPDGTDGIEVRAAQLLDGVLRTFKAVVPLGPRPVLP